MDGIDHHNGSGEGTQPLTMADVSASLSRSLPVEGTNVVRVPFGARRPRRTRPARPDHWATLVLPFQAGGRPTPPPPWAA